jgi:ethanolamine utilization protein EutN
MMLCKVTGTIVSTQKNENLAGQKILIVHPVDLKYDLSGDKDMLALDFANSGVGDIVMVVQEGDVLKQILGRKDVPVHTGIVAVVDNIYIPGHE